MTLMGRGVHSAPLDRLIEILRRSPVRGAGELAASRARFEELLTPRGGGHLPLLVRPRRTRPVSTTGSECALDCKHCGGKFLGGMVDLETAVTLAAGDDAPDSWLLSGGCDAEGGVPVPGDDALESLARVGRINWHPGLASPGDVERAAPHVDCVSFDFVGSDATIKGVLGLDATVEDYLATYRELVSVAPVVPHVVVGLDGGRIDGEYRALELLAAEEARQLVLLVLWPARGTAFEGMEPPRLEEVFDVFARAREMMPLTRVSLGCMRPPGSYRVALDAVAAATGFDMIVQPSSPVVDALGGDAPVYDQCCAFAAAERGMEEGS